MKGLTSIKIDMELMKMLCILPDEDIGVGIKAIYRLATKGEEQKLEQGGALVAFNILRACYHASMVEHEAAVARGKKSAQVQREKRINKG